MGALFRRFHIPKIAPPLYGFYIKKVLQFKVPLVRKLLCSEDYIFRTSPIVYGSCVTKILLSKCSRDIVCSHHSPNGCLSISVIRCQWVYPPKSCVTWSRTPTLWIEAHIFVNKGWESVKLIYKQKAVKSLKCGDYFMKRDIIETK